MKRLNLGCGSRFRSGWVNVDHHTAEGVLSHDLREPLPFSDNSFDVVYHSHVLEHFSPDEEAPRFLKECFRVLRPDGVLRVVLPDLEALVREYLVQLEDARKGSQAAAHRRDWMVIEILDQCVRTRSGGRMMDWLAERPMVEADYVLSRLGEEGEQILASLNAVKAPGASPTPSSQTPLWKRIARRIRYFSGGRQKQLPELLEAERELLQQARFRASGEIHQWMYDEISLRRLLESCGFQKAQVMSPVNSQVSDWQEQGLDTQKNGIEYKIGSLYMEARR